jgi:hypothetical protein
MNWNQVSETRYRFGYLVFCIKLSTELVIVYLKLIFKNSIKSVEHWRKKFWLFYKFSSQMIQVKNNLIIKQLALHLKFNLIYAI